MCPPFLPDSYFSQLGPLAGPTGKKIQNYFFKISSQDPGVVFCLVFITGLGIEIGHRQAKPQRSPIFSSFANPAVVAHYPIIAALTSY